MLGHELNLNQVSYCCATYICASMPRLARVARGAQLGSPAVRMGELQRAHLSGVSPA